MNGSSQQLPEWLSTQLTDMSFRRSLLTEVRALAGLGICFLTILTLPVQRVEDSKKFYKR